MSRPPEGAGPDDANDTTDPGDGLGQEPDAASRQLGSVRILGDMAVLGAAVSWPVTLVLVFFVASLPGLIYLPVASSVVLGIVAAVRGYEVGDLGVIVEGAVTLVSGILLGCLIRLLMAFVH
jgi:hypothetical protein